jgi:hypothetical protein
LSGPPKQRQAASRRNSCHTDECPYFHLSRNVGEDIILHATSNVASLQRGGYTFAAVSDIRALKMTLNRRVIGHRAFSPIGNHQRLCDGAPCKGGASVRASLSSSSRTAGLERFVGDV